MLFSIDLPRRIGEIFTKLTNTIMPSDPRVIYGLFVSPEKGFALTAFITHYLTSSLIYQGKIENDITFGLPLGTSLNLS